MKFVEVRVASRRMSRCVTGFSSTRLCFYQPKAVLNFLSSCSARPTGITAPQGQAITDPAHGWLPSPDEPMRSSILRGWKAIVNRGYATVYQDTRGRYASGGEDRVYADDAHDGYDTLEWIAAQPWTNQRVGMSGSSAGATTTLAAASTRHHPIRLLRRFLLF